MVIPNAYIFKQVLVCWDRPSHAFNYTAWQALKNIKKVHLESTLLVKQLIDFRSQMSILMCLFPLLITG